MLDLQVETRGGRLEGERVAGARRWRGVRYARARRFEAPQPLEPWPGVRPAKAFAPQCPQHFAGPARSARTQPPGYGEDCLALNIWSPDGGEAGLKPVLVWIHGGAFVVGAGDAYDGRELACLGDMLVVTVNYRLGALGFVNFGEALGLPAIPSNLGLRDQIAALEWIRDNIEAFGGDPARVTVAGESAGSIAVALLMHARSAWPLFAGAIMQSGAASLIHDRENSRRIARRYADLLALNQGDAERLRTLDLTHLFAAQSAVAREERNGIPAAPWFDGDLLPASFEAACAGATAPVPLIAGATREEIRLFEVMPGDILPTRWAELEQLLRRRLPAGDAERILAAYPRTRRGRRALATDLAFAMPTRHFAHRHAADGPTWLYRFDYAHPLLGACHALDLAFLWPLPGPLGMLIRGGPLTGGRKALADRLRANWAHFVRHGRPRTDWLAYTPTAPNIRLFGLRYRTVEDADATRAAAWAGRDVGPGFLAPPPDGPPPG
jgi:para-nitrobenzyl esterase